MIKKTILFLLFIGFSVSYSQKSKTTFGIQYKPILPVKLLNVSDLVIDENGFDATISPILGHNFGGLIRWEFTEKLSMESGLSYIRRNFRMDATLDDTLKGSLEYGVVNYEIPFQALFYVRLGKRYFMNVASGFSMNFRASDVGSSTENRNFSQITLVQHINLAYIANIGFEYRTKESGYFYLGASLTTLLRPLGRIEIRSLDDNNFKNVFGELSGNYISVDLRYFFNDKKEK